MQRNAELLLEEALQLPEAERGKLVAKLLESLDATEDENFDPEWDEEIRLRIEEVESGKEVPIPHEQAMRMIFGNRNSNGD
jgi:putative addiction module component (TIGR02574 family)